jgi:peptidoglycan glycosyltransferase
VQEAARDALGSNEGAVVALDPRNGNVLALYSTPGFDPNTLSSGTDEEIRGAWETLNEDPSKPLLPLATQELFLPGSSFKLVTASAALENGHGLDSTWQNPHRLTLPLTNEQLQNFGDEFCNGGSPTVTLLEAFQESCNVTYAEVGLKLGAANMAEQAQAYGLCLTDPPSKTTCDEQTISFELPFQNGRFPEPSYFERNDPLLAFSAIGLDNDLVNPMQMALIASAIAHDGSLMNPRVVTQVRDAQGRVAREFQPRQWGQPISDATAEAMTQMMISVVNGGTGYLAAIPGIQVAGKTGTATNGPGEAPNAWFTAFAPAAAPRVVVSAIVLDGGDLGSEATGGQVAAPIVKQVIEAALS